MYKVYEPAAPGLLVLAHSGCWRSQILKSLNQKEWFDIKLLRACV